MANVDNRLQLGYGSAWHVLRCLGWRRKEFSAHVAKSIGANSIEWLDFPVGGSGFYPTGAPIRDSEWTRLAFATADARVAYDSFWPKAGTQQNWDVVGLADYGNAGREFVLVEAKAHTGEIKFKGTEASEKGGRPVIRQAFVSTLLGMGRSADEATALGEAWLGGCYQHANRLATLYFLLREGVPARAVFLYFCGDAHPHGNFDCPSTPEAWKPTLTKVKSQLGLHGDSELETRTHDVFVDVNRIDTGDLS
jgi:hypothetical protein